MSYLDHFEDSGDPPPWNADEPSAPGYEPPADAHGWAEKLRDQVYQALSSVGHGDCDELPAARYVPNGPEGPTAMCGCGVFVTLAGSLAYDAAEQRETLASGVMGLPAPGHPKGGSAHYEAADPITSALALIDPTELYTPVDLERHILDVLYRLETGALFERQCVRDAYNTAQAFEMKFQARIHASEASSVDRRKADAMVFCQAEYEAMIQAKMMKEAVKQTMHNLRAVLTGYQSVGRSVSATYQAGGSQGGTPTSGGYR